MIALPIHDPAFRTVLDYAGVAVFAVSGALAAARRKYDIVTLAFFASVTGIGGGTLRDLLIGAPVFWVVDAGYIAVCIACAGIVWGHRGEDVENARPPVARRHRPRRLRRSGRQQGRKLRLCTPGGRGVMGVLSASFGGIVRDVLAGEPRLLLRKEIYVTAAVLGAGLFVVLRIVGMPEAWAGRPRRSGRLLAARRRPALRLDLAGLRRAGGRRGVIGLFSLLMKEKEVMTTCGPCPLASKPHP